MSRKTLLILTVSGLVIFGAVLTAAVLLAQHNNDKKAVVEPKNFRGNIVQVFIREDKGFDPQTVQIKVGDTVSWRSKDEDGEHSIAANPHPSHTSLPQLFSPRLMVDEAYSYTFTKTGTYHYHDDVNPTLNGTVIVK